MAGNLIRRPQAKRLTCMRTGCGGPRQKALLLEWEDTRAGKSPMRAFVGLEVCSPCAWSIKRPTEVMKKEALEQVRETIVSHGIGSPKKEAGVRYCDIDHPEYVKFKKIRGL